MKILHTADVHIDSKLNANLPDDKIKLRREEIIRTFAQIADYATQNNIQAVLICGDLFDRATVTKKSREAVIEIFRSNSQVNFYYLSGNHDSNGFGVSDGLPENLYLFGDEWTYYQLDGVTLAGCENVGTTGKYAELNLDKSNKNIVMLHGEAVSGRVAPGADRVVIKELKDRGIDYLALGHIHSYKCGNLDRRGVYCNPGIPAGRGFDECNDCGFVVIDTEQKKIQPQFIPCPGRRFHTVEVDISGAELQSEIDAKVNEAVMNIPDCDLIKLVLTGKCSPATVRDVSHIAYILNERFFFAKVYDKTGVLIDRSLTEGEISLKGEFINTVLAEMAEGEDRDLTLEYGLRALGGEEI